MMKKFTPAGRGTLKKFFQKYFPEPLRRFSGRERPPMPIQRNGRPLHFYFKMSVFDTSIRKALKATCKGMNPRSLKS